MLIKNLMYVLVLLLVVVIYVTLPASHRFTSHLLDHHHTDGHHHHLASSPSSSSSRGQKQPSQLSPQDHHHHESSSASHDDTAAGDDDNEDATNRRKLKQSSEHAAHVASKHPQMEPTDFVPNNEYLNPYKPLKKSGRPCSSLKYTRGRWVKREQLPKPLYPALGEILGCCERGFRANKSSVAAVSSSSASLSASSSPSLRPELFYEWVPDECDLVPWSEELFCKALRGRDIMLAGDSLNDHWHASLYYLLGGRKDIYKREGTIAGKHRCHGHAICGKFYKKPLKLHFLTNQFLDEKRLINRNYKWWKPIGEYPVLVLNSGSWMRDPADETRVVPDARWQEYMKKALGLVKRQRYNGTIIWRTTYSGHPWCWRYTAPLDAPLSPEALNPKVAPYDRYRWEFIPERNRFTTGLWSRAGAHILDVEHLTNLMPLGHLGQNHPKFATRNATDCLHYCSPGPVYDTWSELLMNLLLGNL